MESPIGIWDENKVPNLSWDCEWALKHISEYFERYRTFPVHINPSDAEILGEHIEYLIPQNFALPP